MKIKVELEVDGILLERLEGEDAVVAQDAAVVISNMVTIDATGQVKAHVDELNQKRQAKKAKAEKSKNEVEE